MQQRENILKEAIDFARRFADAYTPSPVVALLAGSRAKGTSRPNSDYDIVFLYDNLPQGAWREMISFESEIVELFAHDLSSLSYFLAEIERPSGEAGLACMVDQGISVFGACEAVGSRSKKLARDFLLSGPLRLDEAAMSQKRYAITDLAESLSGNQSKTHTLAVGSALYTVLANFILLANGRWAAGGKALSSALYSFDPLLERSLTSAFEQLYSKGDDEPIQKLVTDLLRPFGGPLRVGFRQQAPASWRR